jgi:hypothetical protein
MRDFARPDQRVSEPGARPDYVNEHDIRQESNHLLGIDISPRQQAVRATFALPKNEELSDPVVAIRQERLNT